MLERDFDRFLDYFARNKQCWCDMDGCKTCEGSVVLVSLGGV